MPKGTPMLKSITNGLRRVFKNNEEAEDENEGRFSEIINWADENNIGEDRIPRDAAELMGLNRLDLSFRLITFAEDHRIFFNLGPYFAYAVSSKLTRGGEVVSENPKAKAYTKSYDMLSNGHIKRFEFGLQASAMYQWKQLYLRGGIEASAFNQLKLWVPGSVAKGGSASRYIMSYITLGYEF